MQGKTFKARGAVRQAIKAGLFSTVGIAGLLAGASVAHADSVCEVTGDVTLFACDTSITTRIEYGSSSLTVDGATVIDDGISYYTWGATLPGEITSTLIVNNSSVSTVDNGGVNVSSNIEGRNDISVTLGQDVTVTSNGGYGSLWVRNEKFGDIVIDNGADLNAFGIETNGISATTNAGSVDITNSGDIKVHQTNGAADFTQRGIYADGGFNDVEPVEVTVTNTGQIEAQAAGIRVVNYNGLAKITNNALVSSVDSQALVGWTPNGEVVIDNQINAYVTSDFGTAIQGASQIGDITITNAGGAEGQSGILAIAGFEPAEAGSGEITITNTGVVTALSGNAIQARTPVGNVNITNTGDLESSGGGAGIDADTQSGTVLITNSGSIKGETGIVTNSAATTIINSGSIQSTQPLGHAILMGAGDVTLELRAGSSITGLVADADVANGTNMLALGGTVDASFDAGLVGVQYNDFDEFVKTGSSSWTLTGSGSTGWTVKEGALLAGSNEAFGLGQAYVVEGGVLNLNGYTATLGSLSVAEGSAVSTGGGTLILDQADDSVFAGALIGSGSLVKAGEGTLTFAGNGTSFGGMLDVTEGLFELTGNLSTNMLTVGGAQLASLSIANGGHVTGNSMRIGGLNTAIGGVSVDGATSTLVIGSGRIGVGVAGEGTFMVSNGGSASSEGAIIGWEATGKGTATVTGTESAWTNDGILYVANAGEGTLNITEGGRVTSTDGYVGTAAGSKGAVNISGADSIWDMSGLFIAGHEAGAESSITISNGGTLRAVQGTLGNLAGSQASMIVTGAGSTWSAYDDNLTSWAGYINVGLFGSGTLTVSNGGTVEAVRVYIGNDVSSSGSVALSGAGSAIRTEEGLYIGAEGAGDLTLANAAQLSAEIIKIGYLTGSSGTLNIGAAAGSEAAAAGVIDAVNGIQFGVGAGKLVLNHTGTDYALASSLSGNGVVDVLAGTTILSGDGSGYTGVLNVNSGKLVLANVMNASSAAVSAAGTLQIGDGGTSGTLAGDVLNNGTLVFNRTDGSSYGGSITGQGTIVNAGTGKLVLSGDSSAFAGQTKVDAGTLLLTGKLNGTVTVNASGTLQVGDGVHSGDLTASTVNDGTLIFNQLGDYDYTGALSGNGSLVKQGEGTLLLSGDYGYTGSTVVQAGRVRLLSQLDSGTDLVVNDGEFDLSGTDQTVAGLSGTGGTVNIGTSTLTVNQGENTVFGGSFSGSGSVVLQGPSVTSAPVTINLTGASLTTFTGSLNLSSIITRVNGSMGGTITVGSDAALGGGGQVNNIVIGSGGTLLPGNSIGTLTATGNVVFQAGSTYEVEVNADGGSDKLIVDGTVTIQGGTVSVLAAAGNYRFTSDYTIITAAGGVTGTFAGTDVDLPFLTPELSYDANNVRLTLTRNSRSFESVAVTPNQLAVALALDASDDEASLSRAVAGQIEEAGAVRAFDALSGELWATTGTLMVDGTRRLGDMVIGRMEQADVVSRTLSNAGSSARTLRDGSTAVWGQGIGAWSTLKSNGNAVKATQSTFGFITGVDTGLGAWRLGVAFAHEQNKVRVDGRSSEATVNGNSALVYASGGWGALRARVGASYSWLDVSGTRKVAFLGVNDALAGSYDARSASAFGEVSYAIPLGAVTAEPFGGVAHVHLKSDAFTETGSALTALGVTENTRDVTYTTLGLRLGGAVPVSATTVVSPRVSAAWLRSFGDVDATSRNILSTGQAFSVAGLPTTRDTLRLEGGLQANILPGGSIGATYVGNIGDQWKDHGVKIGFSYSF